MNAWTSVGAWAIAALLMTGCGCGEQRLPDPPPKTAPSKADLMEFQRQRALALDSLLTARSEGWSDVVRTGTGIRYEVLDRNGGPAANIAVDALAQGTVLELHHRFGLLDGRSITSWQQHGPLAFEPGATDLPAGFHELVGLLQIGDSVRALIPPSQAWGMSGRPPEIPQEAVIHVEMRVDLYSRP